MPIHFGMPTLIECPHLEQSLLLCSEMGLDFVELNMNLSEYQLDRIDISATKQILGRYGKYTTIHLDENLNVCDFNTAVADAYLNTVLCTITLAQELNAPIINMHMYEGVYFTLPDRKIYLFAQYKEQYLDKLRRFRNACDNAIGESNILICIENCGAYHAFQRDGIDLLLKSPRFALTYDVGHDFCAGNANENFILNRARKLSHMHLHDAVGNRNHLTLGTGELDIAGKLRLAQNHGCRCVLETKTLEALRQSVAYLRSIAECPESISIEAPFFCGTSPPSVTSSSTNDEKAELFQSLFKGREDIYARRWESKDGQKTGYAPACRNEWVRGVCEKPRIKCGGCKNRESIPLDRNVIARHLSGKEVVGIYPLLSDETCLFLAMDFDEEDWRKDVAALRQVCENHAISIAVERSRSGNGAHIWFFFDEPISASAARKFGAVLLTSVMEQYSGMKFSSYDRLFPNQDTMPKGGFGNLIALPLQRKSRSAGNCVFIDENCVPYADQWAFLSTLRRLTVDDLNRLTALLGKNGELGE